MRIAINGLGRIGKNFLWSLLQDKYARQKITIAAINIGPANKALVAHLFKYDSILGAYPGSVELVGNELAIDGTKILLLEQSNAALLPWATLQINWVVDCSGKYTHREKALEHIAAGAQKVLISAPAHDEDITIIPGVNDATFNKEKHALVSLGSCTTNALAPVLKVLQKGCGLQSAFMTTVHAYTNSQVLLDVNAHDARRSRAAAVNIIPTSTGATDVIGRVIPELNGKIQGVALRVPVDDVSIIDLCFESNKNLTSEMVNKALKEASRDNSLKNIVGYTAEPLVSSDFKRSNYSVVIDSLLTQAHGSTAKVFGWYDNEWGYSERLKDFLTQQVG